jgi:hypothetical protein
MVEVGSSEFLFEHRTEQRKARRLDQGVVAAGHQVFDR